MGGLPVGPLIGLGVVVLVTLGMATALGAVLYSAEIARRLRRLAPRRPARTGLPIERIARTARCLRGELAAVPPGTPLARRRALSSAYDDLLIEACRELGVPDTLSGMAPGLERDSERLHVEQELEDVGMRLSG